MMLRMAGAFLASTMPPAAHAAGGGDPPADPAGDGVSAAEEQAAQALAGACLFGPEPPLAPGRVMDNPGHGKGGDSLSGR